MAASPTTSVEAVKVAENKEVLLTKGRAATGAQALVGTVRARRESVVRENFIVDLLVTLQLTEEKW